MKKLLALLLVALMATTLLAGVASAEEPYKIGMLPKFKGENYFDGCYVGAANAAEEFGIELVYDGPHQSEATNAKQVEILTGWLSQDFDAIVVSPCDAEGIASTLRQFQDKGVLVLTFDADAPSDARTFYVNQATPRDIAVGLVDVIANGLIEGGFGPDVPARLALISGSGLDVNQNEWILAIEAYLAETYPWLTVDADEVGYLGPDIWTPGSDETAAQNAANESIALSGNATDGSQINAVIGTSSMSTPALAAAWDATVGDKPEVVITGLATPMGIVDYILDEDNPMDYGVLWDVNNLGYLSIEAAIAYLNGEIKGEEGEVFPSNLGDKHFVLGDDGGLELLLGAALTFGPDNVESFNY
ncbi:MAG: substrate-binding domain-containing protein [Clostridiales bacterium]|nr:substrate-binding domain-containing protein [Clostridiales bacterium]